MRIIVDRTRCESQAVCTSIAPEIFEIDDDDVMHVLDETPPASVRHLIEEAVMHCPKQALSIEKEA